MAGIYIHIPFCKTRCIYCDFYSTTRSDLKFRYIQALCRELEMRKDYLQGASVKTVYFGGGTPSQLDETDFRQVFATLTQVYGLQDTEEITLEANPDDLTDKYVSMLQTLPFNRISMGIQTFDNAYLKMLNRRHNAGQAIEAVKRCRRAGFHNISIDLIYGLPGETEEHWKRDLAQAVDLDVEHISAYHLTYEEGTRLYRMRQEHLLQEVDEDASLCFFTLLADTLAGTGYKHYEISNFCKPGKHSRHNSAYWEGIPYLGCGPSAHSFNTHSREWNISSLEQYIVALKNGHRDFEEEQLDVQIRYNEYIMTALRTAQGLSIAEIGLCFSESLQQYCLKMATPHLRNGLMEKNDDRLRLTRKGIFVSDGIISDLMVVVD